MMNFKNCVYPFLRFLIVFFLLIISEKAFAQPSNDNCAAAATLIIPNSGFSLGLFAGGNSDITSATIQTGETFAPSIIVAGLNKKSVWYKFSLPTTRAARISLAQPGSAIQNGDVGFAVYKANTCLPGNTEISTKFTPIEIFGSSFHPCVDAGDYLVQVTSNLNAKGPVFITLDLAEPSPALYDKPAGAYPFGNLTANEQIFKDVDISCQTVDNVNEVCLPVTSFKNYTKSIWYTFKTPAYFDYVNTWFSSINTAYPAAPIKVGYRIYQGDATITPVSSLTQIGGCDSLITDLYAIDYKKYGCGDLRPNTTYTVQLLFDKDFVNTIRFGVDWKGTKPTVGPLPVSTLATPNRMGTLNANGTAGGAINTVTDVFGCNSRHSQNNCPKSMPVTGVLYNGYRYNMSSFVSFNLASTSSIFFFGNKDCNNLMLFRLYKQGLPNVCTGLDTSNIISTFEYNTYQVNPLSCLAPGNYVLQVLSVDSSRAPNSLHFSSLYSYPVNQLCVNVGLGSSYNLNMNVRAEVASNRFSLAAPGKFEKINANGAGVMQPLVRGTTYTSQPDTLGCANTVLPAGDICEPTGEIFNKITYREFVLKDSMIFNVQGNLSNAKATKIYRGDANALAISQSVFNYPQTINGLQPVSGCYNSSYRDNQNACLIPGTYTIANFDNRLNLEVTTKFTMSQPVTKFKTSATAQDMGDIWTLIDPVYNSVRSEIDTFTCFDNPQVIDGVSPCVGIWSVPATKQIYRQFYLSKPALVSIRTFFQYPYYTNFAGSLTLFAGKATGGLGQLKNMGTKWTCFTNAGSSQCEALPVGWYTVVSYGVGPTFAKPLPNNIYDIQLSDIGLENAFYITLTTACPTPKFNRPNKASIDTLTGQPYLLQWGPQPGNTAAYPITGKKYTLNVENFDCSQDTTFINKYMLPCSPANKKVSFYVFRITQESYVQVGSMPYDFVTSLYNFDVRGADSVRLKKDAAIQPCLTNGKVAEFCKLQPGLYTLVIYGSDAYSTSCISITPKIYVDKVGISRFDHANNAYDFGAIIPDSTWRYGKPGDVNPLDAGRAPSNDFFYCTTGAQPNDPDMAACFSKYNPNIYKIGTNSTLHPDDATAPDQYTIDRRNLWYSFTVEHAGKVRIRVQNKTPGKTYQQPFAIYKSDVDGTLAFPKVVGNGAVDSTLAQGLVFITRNHGGGAPYNYCNGPEEIEFFIPPCSFKPTRYYIMVENRNPYPFTSEVYDMSPNSQVEVAVLFDSVSARPPKFDHFSQANDLGLINSGIKKGETDNFTCATRDLDDPINYTYVTDCNKTLWYKFTTTTTGTIRYSAFFKNTNNNYYDHAQLFKQVLPNDSSSKGLKHLLYTSTHNNNGSWAQLCIEPGTYYLLLPGCNAVDEDVYPQVEIIPQAGDFCSAPMVASVNGPGSAVVPVIVDCHTIGSDYGELNPTLTCPAGMATNQYKTSWYRLDIKGTDTLDVTVYINENTNASNTDIKYRMMTGNCGAMQEQSCVQDALTRNTYKCLAPGNSYFIQVFTPVTINGIQVTGTIDLNISAVPKADTCLPSNNCIAVANFISSFDCTKDQSVRFINNSTFGTSVGNKWDFGYNNQTSTAVSPTFFYPALTVAKTYTVKLLIKNNGCGKMDSVIQTVNIPARPAVNLGRDTVICANGATINLNATSHVGATYAWFDGSTQPTINIGGVNPNVYVEVTYAGCKARDTVSILVNPIAKRPMNTKALCGVPQVTLDAARGFGEQFTWSTGASTSSIVASQAAVYWVDIYWKGCTTRDSFNVISNELKPLGNDITLCQNQLPYTANATVNGATSYTWQNNTTNSTLQINKAGLYFVDIVIGGCTFRDSLLVAIDSVVSVNTVANICAGQNYTLPWGTVVNTTGIYSDTLRYKSGCDSLRRSVNLTLKNFIDTTTLINLCGGQNYTLPWGPVVNASGIYRDTVRYVNGCDSLRRTINLSVKNVTAAISNVNICAGQTYTLPSGAVVNSSGIYRDTLRYVSGCDSLQRTVNLTVKSFTSLMTNVAICLGQTYTLPWGTVVSTAGTYKDTLRYVTGCDSIRRTVNLVVQNFTTSNINANLCNGKTYTLPWGAVVNTAGIYRDTLRYSTGCDSIRRVVNVTVQNFTAAISNINICSGQTYTLPSGTVVSSSGIYKDTLRYVSGCDSLQRTINLTVQSFTSPITNVAICSGQTYTLPWGAIVSTAGIYRDTLRHATGCDSIRRTVNLIVQNFTTSNLNANLCNGQTYTLPWGAVVNTAGVYRDTLRYKTGCDSIRRTVNLTVQNVIPAISNVNICNGQTYTLPWGVVVSSSGIYKDTLRYSNGCDSVRRTINLIVQNVSTTNSNVFICQGQSYTLPWGAIVNYSGLYRDTLRYKSGCDSIRKTVNLTVQNFTTTSTNANICAGASYTLPWGKVVNSAGTYRDTLRYLTGCDSIRKTVILTVQNATTKSTNVSICAGQSYTLPSGAVVNNAGIYKDTLRYASGCDSLIRIINLKQQTVNEAYYAIAICAGQKYKLPWGAIVNVAGVYRDTLSNLNGCDSVRRIYTLSVNPLPVTAISSSNEVNCALGTTKLNAYDGANYVWTPSASLDNPNICNPIASPTANTLYRVTVTHKNGCVVKDSVMVKFDGNNSGNKYLVPTAFTPNNDGLNDCFSVSHWGKVTEFSMTIFNRFGERVFTTTNPTVCWDGNVKGEKQNSDVYVYIINANGVCGPIVRKGSVVLIR